jgi:hypothetical protein
MPSSHHSVDAAKHLKSKISALHSADTTHPSAGQWPVSHYTNTPKWLDVAGRGVRCATENISALSDKRHPLSNVAINPDKTFEAYFHTASNP